MYDIKKIKEFVETVMFLAEQRNIPRDQIIYYYIHSDLKTLSTPSVIRPMNDVAYIIVVGSLKWKNGSYINTKHHFLAFFDDSYNFIDKIVLGNWAITNIEFTSNYYFQIVIPSFEIHNINDDRVIKKQFPECGMFPAFGHLKAMLEEYSIFDECSFKDVFISPCNESYNAIKKELTLLGLHTKIQVPLVEEIRGRKSYDKFIISYNYELSESQLKVLLNLLKKYGCVAVQPQMLLSQDSKFCFSIKNSELCLLENIIITKKEPITNIYDGEYYKGIPLKKLLNHKDLETYLENVVLPFIEPIDIDIFLSYLEDNMSKEDILKTFNVISYKYADEPDDLDYQEYLDYQDYNTPSSCSWEEVGRDEMESWENGWEWNID